MKQQKKKSEEAPQEKESQILKDDLARIPARAEDDLARAGKDKADERDRGRITSITIENFKGIGDAVNISISPITLLFGKNSSGKSTVLQALRYHYFFRQTQLEGPDSQIEMAGGHNIDLADFRSLVHRHDLNRKIRVRVTYAPKEEGEKIYILWEELITSWRKEPHSNKLKNTHVESILLGYKINNKERCFITSGKKPDKAVFGLNREKLAPIDPTNLAITSDDPSFILARRERGDDFIQKNFGRGILEPKKLDDIRHLGPFREVPFGDDKTLKEALTKPDSCLRRNDTDGWDAHVLRSTLRVLLEFDDKTLKEALTKLDSCLRRNDTDGWDAYGLRSVLQVLLEFLKMTDESRWEKGAGAWEALEQDLELLEKTNDYMQDALELRYSINQHSINQPQSQSTKLLHYKDNDEDNGIDIGLSDVGIGISQLIPVVIGALDKSQNYEIFAVEQPELHIHPALQVALGDMFIDAIKNNNRTILIETHSEHLLLRLLRRVRETTRRSRRQTTKVEQTGHELTPNDLSVVYVRPTSAGVKFTRLTVTNKGDFDAPWPEGFFAERESEWY